MHKAARKADLSSLPGAGGSKCSHMYAPTAVRGRATTQRDMPTNGTTHDKTKAKQGAGGSTCSHTYAPTAVRGRDTTQRDMPTNGTTHDKAKAKQGAGGNKCSHTYTPTKANIRQHTYMIKSDTEDPVFGSQVKECPALHEIPHSTKQSLIQAKEPPCVWIRTEQTI